MLPHPGDEIVKELLTEIYSLRGYLNYWNNKYPNGASGCCCLFDDDYNQIVWCEEHKKLKEILEGEVK